MSDNPIDPRNYLYGINIVDIADARVKRGKSRTRKDCCKHLQMVYDPDERRVQCENCGSDLDSFDAFLKLVQMHDKAQKQYKEREEKVKQAEEENIGLIACKNLQKEFRKKQTAPTCPHCKEGLLPEDFKNITLRVSKSLLIQKRKTNKSNEQA